MSDTIQKLLKFFSVILCLLSTWIILGSVPALQLQGMFRQVDTQILILHTLGGGLFILKGLEFFFFKEKIKDTNNIFFLLIFFTGLFSLFSAFLNDYFFITLLGSYQIGQGAFWYFDFSILILFFSTLLGSYYLRVIFLINIFLLTTVATIFTLNPFWKGINISFFYFSDYLCYFGIMNFILMTTVVKNKYTIFFAYCFLGWYLSLLDNRAALILWGFVLLMFFLYELLSIFRKKDIIEKLKNFLFSNLLLSFSVLSISIVILISSLVFWSGDGALPTNIGSSALASLVVRGKLIEVVLSDFFSFKNLLIGEGWGRVPDLLLSSMNAWQFDQLTVGYNLHFHSHNEVFEHFFSLGILGLLLFLLLIYYTLKNSELISIYTKLGWILFFYVSCFWFFWAGTLPLFALTLGTLAANKNSRNHFFEKVLDNNLPRFGKNKIFSIIFILVGTFQLYGSYLNLSYIKEYKKISYGALASLSKDQNLSEIKCENFYVDKRGGDTVASFINSFPSYLKRNNLEYDNEYLKIIETLQCISEEIIFKSEANLNLITASIQLDTKLFFSNSNLAQDLINSNEKFKNYQKKVLMLAKQTPKRGDLIMPFLAIALKKNKFDEIENLCSDREIVGIEGYCYLISSYKILSSDYLSNNDIINGVNFIKKAIEKGILDEKVYGWWLFDDLRLYGKEFSPSGIPLSADLIYYISTNEALKLLDIINKFE